MIKEDKVLVPINIRNRTHYSNLGYDVNGVKILEVSVCDLRLGSKVRITAICEICHGENEISYSKYIVNKNRNNKGYYSCFKCKNIEKEKTCIKNWGVKSYSMTDEFRISESKKWKGKRKNFEKYQKTMIERYGVDCYFKLDEMKEKNRIWMSSTEFREKSKLKIVEKWGVESYSMTDEFKNRIKENKDEIVNKIRSKFLEIYGVDWISKTEHFKEKFKENRDSIILKIKNTCLERYGVDNVSKVESIKIKSKRTKEMTGLQTPDELLSSWDLYRKKVRNLTKNFTRKIYEDWDGYDYYDGEFIKGYQSLSHIHRFFPTIDHKKSIYWGFVNNIPAEEISDISNLCITKRYINCMKSRMIEEEFSLGL